MDQPASSHPIEQSVSLQRAVEADLTLEVVQPVLAGMRARAVADACERSGLAAVLIDAGGRVLHVASRAKSFLDQGIEVAAGHLIGRTRADNVALETALNAALTGADGTTDLSETAYRVRGLPYRDASPYQLLRGVLIFSGLNEEPDVTALQMLLAV